MTLDDESSIYVGGLPYDVTEETIRTVFDLYGAILDVKIINDQRTRGKCYGFVTFTNPRSAVDAINDMNGRTIDGRVIKVNEVKTRGGRSNFGGERFHHNAERNGDWDRTRDRVRDYDHDKDGYRNHNDDRSWVRDRSRDREQKRDRRYEHIHDNDQARESSLDNKRSREGELVDNEWEYSRALDQNMERDHNLEIDTDKKMDRASKFDRSFDEDRNMLSRRKIDLNVSNQLSADLSSDSNGNCNDEVGDEIERSIQRIDLLKNEISQMEERLEEKRYLVTDLQKQSRKLEDALINAKKQTSNRQMQLTMLHKCFLQVKDSTERLQNCEKELQAMVDAAALDIDGGGAGLKDGLLMNGIA